MASVLCIIDQGYRAAVEEQDDTALWMAHMLQRNDNITASVLLRSSAVNYANKAQVPTGVTFGDWQQQHPANFPRDLARFQDDGGTVYVLQEDLEARGLTHGELVGQVHVIAKSQLANLVNEHDQISFW